MGVCVLQVTLAYESIVLYMCEGKVLMDNNNFKKCSIYDAESDENDFQERISESCCRSRESKSKHSRVNLTCTTDPSIRVRVHCDVSWAREVGG